MGCSAIGERLQSILVNYDLHVATYTSHLGGVFVSVLTN
jgi:hypothetical protein